MSDYQPDDVLELGVLDETRPVPVMPRTLNVSTRTLMAGAGGIALAVLGVVAMLPGGTRAAEASTSSGFNTAQPTIGSPSLRAAAEADALPYHNGTRGGMYFTADSIERMKETVSELEVINRRMGIKPFEPGPPPGLADSTGETREP